MITSPRIYYLRCMPGDTEAAVAARLGACRAAGFTHLMLAGATAGSAVSLSTVVRIANDAGLAPLLDIAFVEPVRSISRSAAGRSDPPDPRRLGAAPALPMFADAGLQSGSFDGDAGEPDWHARLAGWIVAGVAGFCCRGLDLHPCAFWQTLIATARTVRAQTSFIAWTPGCSADLVAQLEGCGFDATIASTAWWDYRAPWLAEESVRLARVAPPIALVDDPLQPRVGVAREAEDRETVRQRCERALGLAAASGSGLLMPMGFEGGLGRSQAPAPDAVGAADASTSAPAADMPPAIARANALVATLALRSDTASGELCTLDAGRSGTTVLLRRGSPGAAVSNQAVLIVVNPDTHHRAQLALPALGRGLAGLVAQSRLWPQEEACDPGATLTLAGGGLEILTARTLPPVVHFVNRGKRSADAACRAPRVAIEAITPAVDDGRFPVKRTVGEQVEVEADVYMDGHDKLGVMLLWRPADQAGWNAVPMTPVGNDRWRAALPLRRVGKHLYAIQAWRDAFATYRDELYKKSAAGLDVTLELEEGRLMIMAAASHAGSSGQEQAAAYLDALAGRLGAPLEPAAIAADASASGTAGAAGATAIAGTTGVAGMAGVAGTAAGPDTRGSNPVAQRAQLVAEVLADATVSAMQQADDRPFAVTTEPGRAIDAERLAARFSSWYELFPRSQSGDATRHGSFADVEKRLPAIRDMGFDTLYFPPIHPIGKRNRKGRNNSLTPTDDDPGSPYAIGAADGGHDALHAELGTLADFRHLCDAAKAHGLEIALDFAIQCSPDHPWIKAHPEWFAWRPDGSMRYAENPPKKYEDIVNVDFYAAGAMPALWIALRDAVLFWVVQGVRVFRVDNPHTKPLPFWEWMIADIRSRYPDTLFLSEAFTRPKVMYRLAKVGFSQSYSYFTWRHTKQEFTDYLTELTTTAVQDYFRPNFFVNTPDINPAFLQQSGRVGFQIRAALATLLSGLWGMYSGFELCEATPVPGKEDYLDSEKYEIRTWDWQRPGNIIADITLLNRIRRAHPALQSHLGVQFCESSDPNMLCFMRYVRQPAGVAGLGADVLFVAINLDPFGAHQTDFRLPLWHLGLPDDGALAVEDLAHGNHFTLYGRDHQLHLDPGSTPYAVWRLTPGEHRA